jgi:hypothetical protein
MATTKKTTKKAAPKAAAKPKTVKKKAAAKKAVTKKTPVKKAPVKKAPAKNTATKKPAAEAGKIKVTQDQHYKMVCEAAYYISLERSADTVNPEEDWLQAEAAINKIYVVG